MAVGLRCLANNDPVKLVDELFVDKLSNWFICWLDARQRSKAVLRFKLNDKLWNATVINLYKLKKTKEYEFY